MFTYVKEHAKTTKKTKLKMWFDGENGPLDKNLY
jgi:hypothetical protein